MAIWQYKMFMIPYEEINSYFKNAYSIDEKAFNQIEWWKYNELTPNSLKSISSVLELNKSWSKDIMLYGNEDSDCIEIFKELGKMIEVSIRIDLRNNYYNIISSLIIFAKTNSCVFLDSSLKIIDPSFLKNEVENYKGFDEFLSKLK